MSSTSIFDRPKQLKVNLCGVVRIPADPAVVCLRHGNAEACPECVVRMTDRLSCAKARLRQFFTGAAADSQVLPKLLQNRFCFDHADAVAIGQCQVS